MSSNTFGTDRHLSPYPPASDSSHGGHDIYKASYDDLIDEYGSEYEPNRVHKTVAIAPTPGSQPASYRPPYNAQSSYGSAPGLESPATGVVKGVNWGYPPSPSAKPKEAQSFWSKWLPDSMACRLFVLVVVVETIIDLAVEGDLLLRFHEIKTADDDNVNKKMPIYLSIFVFAHLFQLVMALDAVYARNTLQFLCLAVFNGVLLVYAIIQIKEIQGNLPTDVTGISSISVNVLTTMIPIVISVAELCYIGLGWKIYHEFGWKVYKFIGADRRMKKMYANYQVYQCLIKFDFFFWAGFSIQFIALILQKTDWEYYVTCAALPLCIILLIEGHLAARHESKWMMATFMSGCVGAMVYFVYKLYRVLEDKDDEFKIIMKSLSAFSVLAILLLVGTFILACLVMSNFGHGLKEQLAKNAQAGHGRFGSQSVPHTPGSANQNRMSID